MDEKIELTKVNIVGRKWFNVFKMDDDSFKEIETTEEDFRQQSQKNPINPIIDGGIFHSSYERYKLDTPSGDLEDGQYCDNGDGYLLKSGKFFISADKNELVNGKIQNSIVDEAIQKVALPEQITKI
jgi:hypothetical protein